MRNLSLKAILGLLLSAGVAVSSTYIKPPALIEEGTVTASSGGTTSLGPTSETRQVLTGTSNHTYQFAAVNTAGTPSWRAWKFVNQSTGTLTVLDSASATITTLAAGESAEVVLSSNATAAGTWRVYNKGPYVLRAGDTMTGNLTVPSLTVSGLTASRALQTDGSKNLQSSSVTTTELGYLSGVTSSLQTQIDGKLSLTGGTMSGAIALPTQAGDYFFTSNSSSYSALRWNAVTGGWTRDFNQVRQSDGTSILSSLGFVGSTNTFSYWFLNGTTDGFSSSADWLRVSSQGAGVADGSAGSPSLFFHNNQTTGLYRAGSGLIGIATNGTGIAQFTGDGLLVGSSNNPNGWRQRNEFTSAGGATALGIANKNSGAGASVQFRLENDNDVNAAIIRNSAANTDYAGVGSLNIVHVGNLPVGFATNNTLRGQFSAAGKFLMQPASSSSFIGSNTSDGSDSSVLNLWGSDSASIARSAGIDIFGNQNGQGGGIDYYAGTPSEGARADHRFYTGTGATERLRVASSGEVQFRGSTSGYVGIQAPASVTSYTLTLPPTQGATSTVLTNDGAGNLSWSAGGGGGSCAGCVQLTGSTMSGTLALPQLNFTGSSSGSTNFLASATAAGTYTWPASAPSTSGSYLTATTGGTMSWTAPTTPTVQRFTSTGTTTGYLFTVTAANATAGATYTNNGNTYTVLGTISGGTELFCSQASAPQASGTLTKASGTGDATITFSANRALATYTTPANVLYIRVQMVGGGGGGGASAAGGNGAAGTGTYFGAGIGKAAPGSGGGQGIAGAAGGAYTVSSPATNTASTDGGSGGPGTNELLTTYGMGGTGGVSFFGGAGAGGSASNGTSATANSGSGGGGSGSATGNTTSGAGGGAGAYAEFVLTPTAAQTFPYTIGAAGGGASGAGNGAAGKIIVTEYYQ